MLAMWLYGVLTEVSQQLSDGKYLDSCWMDCCERLVQMFMVPRGCVFF